VAKGRIGLDIGSTAVRAAEVTGGDTPAIVHAAQVSLEAGAVENGEVKEPETVSEALRELWQRGGFKSKQVYLGVGNQRVVVREIALPYMPEKELRASLGFQVQEFIPMPVDDAVLDYDPIGEFEQDERRMLRMLLVAAQRSMVDQVVAAAKGAKLEPIGLDLVPFAIVRSVGTTGVGMDLEDEGDEAVIDIGAHVTNIVVHAGGDTRFVRILPSGGRDITSAIARGLGIDDDLAERLKRGEAVEPQPGEELPGADRVRELAMQRASSFVDEIRSSLEFYTAQAQGARIARVLVTGGGSKLEGFLELLRGRIPVGVGAGQVFQRARARLQVPLSDEALIQAEPLLAVAVGLAIVGRSG
jgi:type IV pilus assembly protein PilM